MTGAQNTQTEASLLASKAFPSPSDLKSNLKVFIKGAAGKRARAVAHPTPAAADSNSKPSSTKRQKQQPPMLKTAGKALHVLQSTGRPGASCSSGIKTPDPEDLPCPTTLRRRTGRRADLSTASGHAMPAQLQEPPHAQAPLHTAVPGATQHGVASSTPLKRAEPFSIGVQYDAYHNNPTEDMPGYPSGYWHPEPSPFAALAVTPLWEEQQEDQDQEQQQCQQQEEDVGKEQQQQQKAEHGSCADNSTGRNDAAGWGYDALHMAYA